MGWKLYLTGAHEADLAFGGEWKTFINVEDVIDEIRKSGCPYFVSFPDNQRGKDLCEYLIAADITWDLIPKGFTFVVREGTIGGTAEIAGSIRLSLQTFIDFRRKGVAE